MAPEGSMADQSPMKRWILTHATRVWTALLTLAGLGAAFVYRPELLTLYLRTTMMAIERGTAALPYPWGDRLEVVLRGIIGLDAICIRDRSRARHRVADRAVHWLFVAPQKARPGVAWSTAGWMVVETPCSLQDSFPRGASGRTALGQKRRSWPLASA